MDTRKEFVKMMCENRNILRLWNARAGDFIWVKEEDYVDCYNEKEGCIYVVFESEGSLCFDGGISCGRSTDYVEEGYFVELSEVPTAVWLPRQDQLQEMAFEQLTQQYPAYKESKLVGYNYNILNLLNTFTNFIIAFEQSVHAYSLLKTTSIEQLWLMFVMKKCFDKCWNEKEWVKDE